MTGPSPPNATTPMPMPHLLSGGSLCVKGPPLLLTLGWCLSAPSCSCLPASITPTAAPCTPPFPSHQWGPPCPPLPSCAVRFIDKCISDPLIFQAGGLPPALDVVFEKPAVVLIDTW
jgi:hypothetical protein